MNEEIAIMNYNDDKIRMLCSEIGPWWALVDVCNLLELSNPRMVAQSLDDDERRKFSLPRQGETWFVNEAGLYHMILTSRSIKAKPFRRWVTHEVLPSIRKKGYYAAKRTNHPTGADWLTPARKKNLELSARVKQERRQMELDETEFRGRYPRDIEFVYRQAYENEYLSDEAIETLDINENPKLSAERGHKMFYTDEAVQMVVSYVWERVFAPSVKKG